MYITFSFFQNEISYQFSSPRTIPPESPIPEIRIETEQENGTYVTSPVEDDLLRIPTVSNSRPEPWKHRKQVTRAKDLEDDDLPPPYPMTESPRAVKSSRSRSPAHTHASDYRQKTSPSSSHPPAPTHAMAAKTMSTKAKGMDNNLYRAVVMEGFQGITGKVTTV